MVASMIHTIEFNLPDDQEDLDIVLKAREMYSALIEIDNVLRTQLKYGERDKDADTMLQVRQLANEGLSGL